MKIISFVNYKGGVSKTTTMFNITGIMASKKLRVLIIDCDPQGNTTNAFGIYNKEPDFMCINHVFDKKDVKPETIVIKAPNQLMPTVDVIGSNKFLDASEMSLVSKTKREYVLSKYIERHNDFFQQYDYVLIDTAPRFSVININVYTVSDEIMLVSDIDSNAYLGCVSVMETWENLSDELEIPNNIHGLIVSRYDKRINMSAEMIDYIHKDTQLSHLLFNTFIPENIKVRECLTVGEPVIFNSKKSVAVDAYKKLYNEMIKRGVL